MKPKIVMWLKIADFFAQCVTLIVAIILIPSWNLYSLFLLAGIQIISCILWLPFSKTGKIIALRRNLEVWFLWPGLILGIDYLYRGYFMTNNIPSWLRTIVGMSVCTGIIMGI